jgi:PAS domain S-box-containing protein
LLDSLLCIINTMVPKSKRHVIWEATTWIFVIVVTLSTIIFFPWYIAQNILQGVLGLAIIAAIFWYFRSRQLYLESQSKSKKILTDQRAIRNHQKTIDLIYENSADGILILDNEERIESFSPGMEKITGYDSEEVVGRLAKQFLKFRAGKGESVLPDLMFMPKDMKVRPYIKNFLTTKEGREVTIEASYTSIKTDDGHKAMAIIRDITYEEDLVARDKEFIAITSHQMNTPLSIMRGYLSLLINGKAGKTSDKQTKYLEEIYNSTKKLIAITDNLLSISRIEQEKVVIEKTELSVEKLADRLQEMANKDVLNKEVTLIIQKPANDFLLMADEEKLVQAISNLIDNSIKYTKKGKIEVEFAKKEDMVDISVTDTGIGIPEEDLEKIGQKFYRSQNAIDSDRKGTGLGMFIAKTIFEKHGGEMKIESKINQGTIISVNIPTR